MGSRIYTVYERGKTAKGDTVFVPEGFSIFAFIFGVLWLWFHRAWFAGGILLALVAVLMLLPGTIGLDPVMALGARLVLGFAVGVFGFDLWRDSLERRGYEFKGVVSAGSKDEAELRYYARQAEAASAAVEADPAPPPPAFPPSPIMTT